MPWTRTKLKWIAGGLTAFVMITAVGIVLWRTQQQNATVTSELKQAVEEFNRLRTYRPPLRAESVREVKQQQERLLLAVSEQSDEFAAFGTGGALDNAQFKNLLTLTLVELEAVATDCDVDRPQDYGYTFDWPRGQMVFGLGEREQWANQLMDVRALCQHLYEARVHTLVSLRRALVSTNDPASVVLLGVRPQTNHLARMILMPYEVVFDGFTGELERVLNRLERSRTCFLVKNIGVQRVPVTGPGDGSTGPWSKGLAVGIGPTSLVGTGARQSASLEDRYRKQLPSGLGPEGRAPSGALHASWAAKRRVPETVLEEKLLRFTLRLAAVRPLEVSESSGLASSGL